jgi:hypothetical protein
MHRIKLFLLLLLIPLVVFAAPATKTKVVLVGHVTQRLNGDAVTVTGYKFYTSKTLGTYPTTPAATVVESASEITATLSTLIPPPASGTHYVVATSYITGEESATSNAVSVYAVGDGTFFPLAPLGVPGPLELQ